MWTYHYVERIVELSLPPIFSYYIYDNEKYYPGEPVDIHIQSLLNIIQEYNFFNYHQKGVMGTCQCFVVMVNILFPYMACNFFHMRFWFVVKYVLDYPRCLNTSWYQARTLFLRCAGIKMMYLCFRSIFPCFYNNSKCVALWCSFFIFCFRLYPARNVVVFLLIFG